MLMAACGLSIVQASFSYIKIPTSGHCSSLIGRNNGPSTRRYPLCRPCAAQESWICNCDVGHSFVWDWRQHAYLQCVELGAVEASATQALGKSLQRLSR